MMGVNIVARLLGLDSPTIKEIEPEENKAKEVKPKIEKPITKDGIKGNLEDIRGSDKE